VTPTHGAFVIEPLDRGFGHTYGNSLRRVLLSTIEGTAVTSVKIEGVAHEFSSIKGVREDVTDIILNLKGVVIRSEGAHGTGVLRLEKDGPAEVRAGDIAETDSLKVLNKDHFICSVAKGGRFSAELTIGQGHGYVPAERN
jgi:DNA-directed RNA polymerase subunit alpha